jgi:NADH-quinone oxidoreductase subunit F
LARLFHRIETGKGNEKDLETIARLCSNMAGQTICAFADAVTGPALSSLKKFRSEFEAHIKLGHCPLKEPGEKVPTFLEHHADAAL